MDISFSEQGGNWRGNWHLYENCGDEGSLQSVLREFKFKLINYLAASGLLAYGKRYNEADPLKTVNWSSVYVSNRCCNVRIWHTSWSGLVLCFGIRSHSPEPANSRLPLTIWKLDVSWGSDVTEKPGDFSYVEQKHRCLLTHIREKYISNECYKFEIYNFHNLDICHFKFIK